MHHRTRTILLLATLALVLTACAAGENVSVDVPAADGNTAGIWTGIWHGLIVPITFIISLFTESVSVYDVHNTGGWYDFGFLVGASTSLGGSGASTRRRRKR